MTQHLAIPSDANRIYAGVGSQKTPVEVMRIEYATGRRLARAGWVLRSGAALGSDWAFEAGAVRENGACEIFLPKSGFNGHSSPLHGVCPGAIGIALSIHPTPYLLKGFSLRAHARNAYQILGRDLKSPVAAVVCWTQDGQDVGGTRTAIKLAERHSIPVLNLGAQANRGMPSVEIADWVLAQAA